MQIRRLTATAMLAGLAALGVGAAPASATSIQSAATGEPYTGGLTGTLDPLTNMVVGSGASSLTCNQSNFTGQITDPGSLVTVAIGQVSTHDIDTTLGEACPSSFVGVNHLDNTSDALAWGFTAFWLSDNTAGTPNGTLILEGFRLSVHFDMASCTFVGDANNTGATFMELEADLHNPDNTASGNTELRLVNEPLENITGGPLCASFPTATLTGTYVLTGGGGDLQIREQPAPAMPPVAPPSPTPVTPSQTSAQAGTAGATGQQAAALKRCAKKKGKARKKCRKRARRLPA